MTDDTTKYIAARIRVDVTVESYGITEDRSMGAKREVTIAVDEQFATDSDLESAVERLAASILNAARR